MVGSSKAEQLNVAVIRAWITLSAAVLTRDVEMLNGLNVFPVPDADTGSNLAATMRGAAHALAKLEPGAAVATVMARAARGALQAGRGNSGVILSEWLRGFAAGLVTGQQLPGALVAASEAAHAAVANPAPGTFLTAAAAAAQGCNSKSLKLADQATEALTEARLSAEHSPQQLQQLARAGVVDSGACGLVLVLAALQAVLQGTGQLSDVQLGISTEYTRADTPGAKVRATDFVNELRRQESPGGEGWSDSGGWEDGYEVMFTLTRPQGATQFQPGEVARLLRSQLAELGNSVVVVGGSEVADTETDSLWHAHVHVETLAAVFNLITKWRSDADIATIQVRHLAVPAASIEIWVVTSAPGLIADFARAGAVVLVPSLGHKVVDEIVEAVATSPANSHLVLVPPTLEAEVNAALEQSQETGFETASDVQVMAPQNDAATALVLLAIAEVSSPQEIMTTAREMMAKMLTATSPTATLPPSFAGGLPLALVVVVAPKSVEVEDFAAARKTVEGQQGELVVINSGDDEARNPAINQQRAIANPGESLVSWAAEPE
jgi:dihydroxyacetone kinase-like predicted kinase